eukprot:5171073-Lingulodinium_polyedra.AAC.1
MSAHQPRSRRALSRARMTASMVLGSAASSASMPGMRSSWRSGPLRRTSWAALRAMRCAASRTGGGAPPSPPWPRRPRTGPPAAPCPP